MHRSELRSAMDDLGVKVVELAAAANVTRRAVGYWLEGRRSIPADVVRMVRHAKRRGYWQPKPGPQRQKARRDTSGSRGCHPHPAAVQFPGPVGTQEVSEPS